MTKPEEKEYDVVIDALQKHRDKLWKMTESHEEWGIMDTLRMEQIQKLDEAIRARLAQPEQEPMVDGWPLYSGLPEQKPVAWRFRINNHMYQKDKWHLRPHKVTDPDAEVQPLYTAHQQREWQGLTDEEAFNAFGFHLWPKSFLVNVSQELKDTHEEAKKEVLAKIRAIEAKLKEKNNGG